MTDNTQAADSAQELAAPSPTVLDIYVVWHPCDRAGQEVFNELVTHYHSERFSGLAGSAIEVFWLFAFKGVGGVGIRRSGGGSVGGSFGG